jgi:hypothetical protein
MGRLTLKNLRFITDGVKAISWGRQEMRHHIIKRVFMDRLGCSDSSMAVDTTLTSYGESGICFHGGSEVMLEDGQVKKVKRSL